MGRKGVYTFFVIISFLILIPLINAQPPSDTQTNINIETGLQIEFTQVNIFEIGKDHLFNAHVFNISTGLRVDNTTTVCTYHLFDNTGNHQIDQVPMEFHTIGIDWDYNVTGGNFTRLGYYSYLITCNTSDIGGFLSTNFEVTSTGFILETSESILYIIILIVTFILFLGFLYPAIKLPYSNKTNKDGSITRISRAKYLKLLCVWFAYGFFMWFLQTLNGISSSFIKLTYLSNFITNIFTYSQGFSVGITFLILTIALIEVWKDIILSKTIKRFGKAFLDGRLQ